MHWSCFWAWPFREEFSRGYVERSIKGYLEVYAAALLHKDDDCVVLIEPAKRIVNPEEAGPSEDPLIHVLLWAWNGHYQVNASGWTEWLSRPFSSHTETASQLETIRLRLQQQFPQAEELLRDVDVPAHVRKQKAWVEEHFRKPRAKPKVEGEGRWERDVAAHRGIEAQESEDFLMKDRITVNPEVCGGRPCIRGLRIRVKDILELLASGATRDEILEDFPYLEPDDIVAALQFAALQSDHPVLRSAS